MDTALYQLTIPFTDTKSYHCYCKLMLYGVHCVIWCTLYYIVYTALYSVHCYIVYTALYSVHCYIVYNVLYSVHCNYSNILAGQICFNEQPLFYLI